MSTPIGMNILSRTPDLVKNLVKAQPKAVVVLNDLGLAHELTHTLPNTIVIFRDWSLGDDRHVRISPQQQIDKALSQHNGTKNLWFYTTNEVGLDQKNLNWHLEILKSPDHLRWVGLNPAVGTYPDSVAGWEYATNFFKTIAAYQHRFIMGIHEYAGAVPNSGMPGFTNRIQNWDGATLPAYHLGRFTYLEQFCRIRNIKIPRIILTEHGFDDTFDIKTWLNTLRVTAGYHNIRGWKSLQDQWQEWYGSRGWDAQRTYWEAIAWANRTLYMGSSVEAQCIYCWGNNGDPQWKQFDVSEAQTFIDHWLRNAGDPVVPQTGQLPPLEPSIAPSPALTANTRYQIDVPGSYVNVRDLPKTASHIIAQVKEGEFVTALEEVKTSTDYWWKIRLANGIEGWVAHQWSPSAKAYRVKFTIKRDDIFKAKSVADVGVNIRIKPTTFSAKIGSIKPGQIFETTWQEVATAAEGMWIRVRLPGGEFGWSSLNYLKYQVM